MDIALIADNVTVATSQTLGFAKFLLRRHHYLISSAILPTDALAPPPVRSTSCRTAPRTLTRKKRRTKRRSSTSGDDSDGSGEGDGFFGGGSDDGPFGGGGYGGRGWNFDGFGGQNWDESSQWWSSNGFAFGFVYEVIYWIALSNCVHFAFKKMVRIVTDTDRDKVPIRLTPIC
ncbi:hypothetical protein ACOSP7_007255 [Xanthoceras sorbifolium]|uniref:Uncharacterized protein n=1 Tax=Xanthoceras sorbifolium TaxID=99658 RepID=A0ABQ8IA55_9ROSI|nr:hypothetical protein JRO89_XS03G0164700 [Xanthoceras sorbifolium]